MDEVEICAEGAEGAKERVVRQSWLKVEKGRVKKYTQTMSVIQLPGGFGSDIL